MTYCSLVSGDLIVFLSTKQFNKVLKNWFEKIIEIFGRVEKNLKSDVPNLFDPKMWP